MRSTNITFVQEWLLPISPLLLCAFVFGVQLLLMCVHLRRQHQQHAHFLAKSRQEAIESFAHGTLVSVELSNDTTDADSTYSDRLCRWCASQSIKEQVSLGAY